MKRVGLVVLASFAIAALAACAEPKAVDIPPVTVAKPTRPFVEEKAEKGTKLMTRKTDTVDSLHGQKIADPYRWLEESEVPEVRDWTETQNAQTRRVLDGLAGRETLKNDVTELLQIGYVNPPAI